MKRGFRIIMLFGDVLFGPGRLPHPLRSRPANLWTPMADETFLKEDLISLRKDLGLTQQGMADQLDMALRSYQSIEAGDSEYRAIHRLAAERVALMVAV